MDEDSPLADFMNVNARLSKSDILIQLKLELASIGEPSEEILSFALYKIHESEFTRWNTSDEGDRRRTNLLEWYRGVDSSSDSEDDEIVSNFKNGKVIVRQYRDRYIRASQNEESLIILFPWGFDRVYLVKNEYITFIHKCIVIFHNLWKLSISMVRYLIQFLFTGCLPTIL